MRGAGPHRRAGRDAHAVQRTRACVYAQTDCRGAGSAASAGRGCGWQSAAARLQALTIDYGQHGVLDRLLKREANTTRAANAVSLTVHQGEILGVVGESGSGKSSLGKAITGRCRSLAASTSAARRYMARADGPAHRRRVQMIFQHPDASLNPRMTVGEIIARPLRLYGLPPGESEAQAVARLLQEVRLPAEFASRYPHALSVGKSSA